MIIKVGLKFEHKEWIDDEGNKVVCEVDRIDYDKERVYFKCLSNQAIYWVRSYWFKRDAYGKKVK